MDLFFDSATAPTLQLYDFQEDAKRRVREWYGASNKRCVLSMPTGAGKTETAMSILQDAADRGTKTLFVVDRRALVKQTSERLSHYGIRHGVIMAKETFGVNENILVCSIQTLMKRGIPLGVGLIIIDETHTLYKSILAYLDNYDGYVLGLTATPFTPGLADIYHGKDAIVNGATTMKLLEWKRLAPVRIFSATRATQIDPDKLDIRGGEFTPESIEREGIVLIGDMVQDWIRLTDKVFGCPVKTLLFGATVAFCEAMCAEFRKFGYDFRTTSYNDAKDESARLIDAFRANEFLGLASVEKLVKGFDVPDVMCIISSRTYNKSLTSHLQQRGRVMRVFPDFFNRFDAKLIIDHVGNYIGFEDQVWEFDEYGTHQLLHKGQRKKTKRKKKDPKESLCQECGETLVPNQETCPGCGAARPKKSDKVIMVQGQMEELEAIKPGSRVWRKNKKWVWMNVCWLAYYIKHGQYSTYAKPRPESEVTKKAALKLARGFYRGCVNEWPPFQWRLKIPQAGQHCDQRVERAARRSLSQWRERQKSKALERPQEAVS